MRFHYKDNELYLGEAEVDITDSISYMEHYKGTIIFYGIGGEFNVQIKRPKGKPLPLNIALKKYKKGKVLDCGKDGTYFIQALGVELLEKEVKARKINPYNYYLKLYLADINDPHKDATVFHIPIDTEAGEEGEEPSQDNFNL